MVTQASAALDTEQERQRLVDEMVSEHGPDWSEQYKPGTFGCHELLDRASLAAKAVEESVLSHPACALSPEWFALAEQAVSALNELYQRIGEAHRGDKPAQTGND